MDSTISTGHANVGLTFLRFIKGLSPKKAIREKSIFDQVYNDLTDKLSLTAHFGDMPINFTMSRDWSKLKEHSVGDIRFRDFYTSNNIISAHNFWAKNSLVFSHCHSNADEFIYLVHGLLEVTIDHTVTLIRPDKDNPFIINSGIYHVIKALETSVFVSKFVIQKI